MAKRGGFPGGMPGNKYEQSDEAGAENAASDGRGSERVGREGS